MKIFRIILLGCLAIVWIAACGEQTVAPPSPDPVDSLHNEGEDGIEYGPVEVALWKVLGKSPLNATKKEFNVTKGELARVTHLPRVWAGLSAGYLRQYEMDLLTACVNLVELGILGQGVTNEQLEALAGLTKLESLKLHGSRISDLSPIARLTNLRTLDIWGDRIADLSPLAGLVNLWSLDLSSNEISDLSPLAGLVNLQRLGLSSNKIADLSPLVGLVQLERLNLRNNEIVDIQPLLDNIGIGEDDLIELQGNKLSDISRQQLIPALKARNVTVRW